VHELRFLSFPISLAVERVSCRVRTHSSVLGRIGLHTTLASPCALEATDNDTARHSVLYLEAVLEVSWTQSNHSQDMYEKVPLLWMMEDIWLAWLFESPLRVAQRNGGTVTTG
jgi:hypothetical protein